jgi:protoporphyrinogen oxidase
MPDRGERRTAVLGAGALGLTVAHRLAERGEAVTVYEAEALPGGLAAGFEIEPGMWLEKFYHHLFRSDRRIAGLLDELGLGDRLEWRRPVTATLRDGRLHQLDSPISLLRFSPLPIADRVRMGAALAYLRALPDPERLEGHTASAWIRRRMGRRAHEVVWGPLLRGKFGAAAEEVAMPWFWARVHDRSPELGYLRGGFQHGYDALAAAIARNGGELRFSTRVEGVRQEAGQLRVTSGGADETFARVVSTLPTRLTARLVPELPEAWRERHDWGRALGAHCLILALDRPLTDAYWVNVNDPGFGFMALVEHTNYRDPAEYGGRHLLYLGNYRPMDDPIFATGRDELVAAVVPQLQRLNPAFRRSWIGEAWAHAAPFAQPIVTTDYRDHIPPLRTPIPGLWLANMFGVYPHDRGQNYSVALAEELVAALGAEAAA